MSYEEVIKWTDKSMKDVVELLDSGKLDKIVEAAETMEDLKFAAAAKADASESLRKLSEIRRNLSEARYYDRLWRQHRYFKVKEVDWLPDDIIAMQNAKDGHIEAVMRIPEQRTCGECEHQNACLNVPPEIRSEGAFPDEHPACDQFTQGGE